MRDFNVLCVILMCCLEKGVKIISNVFLFVSFPFLYLHTVHLHRLERKLLLDTAPKFVGIIWFWHVGS